ncbi:hypothetical protein ACN1NW_000395 [Acinetobacter baumannii]|nr:hypothetical protein [Acinetobacter baumannii]ELA7030984.1 hypothetical protein [Acinetobacter baumannii]ELA7118747.1 hypothetical protein [Acinetobacter baumannii]ELB0919696.1 hypothetical protein [Acinetobacter baumannii]ELB0965872.1 hypothetical protein [Acinetobacter baumannii]
MNTPDIDVAQAKALTKTFIMALNGAFFTVRSGKLRPSAQDIEQAKINVQIASYTYLSSIGELLKESHPLTEETQAHIVSLTTQMIRQTNASITGGYTNKAAQLLGTRLHGAQGQLVQKKMGQLDLRVFDKQGRSWNDPTRLVEAIMTKHFLE